MIEYYSEEETGRILTILNGSDRANAIIILHSLAGGVMMVRSCCKEELRIAVNNSLMNYMKLATSSITDDEKSTVTDLVCKIAILYEGRTFRKGKGWRKDRLKR